MRQTPSICTMLEAFDVCKCNFKLRVNHAATQEIITDNRRKLAFAEIICFNKSPLQRSDLHIIISKNVLG